MIKMAILGLSKKKKMIQMAILGEYLSKILQL